MNDPSQGELLARDSDETRYDVTTVDQDPEDGHELAPRSNRGLTNPFDADPKRFRAELERRQQNRQVLMEWIREALTEGVDWSRLHVVGKDKCRAGRHCSNPNHYSKPTLLKPGAEKICGMLGLSVTFPNLREYERRAIEGAELHNIIIRCHLLGSNGQIIGEGIGGRSLRQDGGDLNKAFKMAEKSAHIDATLRAAGLSEVFTQDLEDMAGRLGDDDTDPAAPSPDEPDQLEKYCPIGKEWRGKPWAEVDDGFLAFIVHKVTDKPALQDRAAREIQRRGQSRDNMEKSRHEHAAETPKPAAVPGAGPKLADFARRLAAATTLDQVIATWDECPEQFRPALSQFKATRERELGPK